MRAASGDAHASTASVADLDHAIAGAGDPIGECVTTTTVRAVDASRSSPQRLEHDRLVSLVQLAGRLVGEDERRLPRGGGGDRHPLLLAAGERRRARCWRPPSPNASSASAAALSASRAPGEPQRGATFSRAESAGQRLSLWKTIAIWRAR